MSAASLLWRPGFLHHLRVLAEFESRGALQSKESGSGHQGGLGVLNAVERIVLVADGAGKRQAMDRAEGP